jgi:hypothetical protein
MKPTFSVFLTAALLLGSGSAEAARGTALGSNPMLPPPSPFSSTPLTPHTNPIGVPAPGQSFGARPGFPGSPTFDPNAALPSLNNSGSAPAAGPTASGGPPGSTSP